MTVRGVDPAREGTANSANTLIAGVGHRFWSDYSAGPEWSDRLAGLEWPANVTVEDYSYGAWAMTQRLQDERYGRCIFLAAEPRDREAASLHVYRYAFDAAEYDPLRVHDHMFEAVAGVISVDLLLVVAGYFRVLPPETWVIEIEPANLEWGSGVSQPVEARYAAVEAIVKALVNGRPPPEVEVQRDLPLGSYGALAKRKGVSCNPKHPLTDKESAQVGADGRRR